MNVKRLKIESFSSRWKQNRKLLAELSSRIMLKKSHRKVKLSQLVGKTSDKGQKIEMSLKKGDKVLYGKYSGTEISIDGQDYLILRESDVLAIL
jgi:co-chaperonin GroES (HSP10)